MVTHHTASLITANPLTWSRPPERMSRSVVSRIAVMDQSSGPVSAGESLALWRFHATRQRAEQNRACSRRGANDVPHCSQFRVSFAVLRYCATPSLVRVVALACAGEAPAATWGLLMARVFVFRDRKSTPLNS